MTTEATQQGAEALSVEERIMGFLEAESPEEQPQEEVREVESISEEEVEEVEEQEAEAKEVEKAEVEEQAEEDVEEVEWDVEDVAQLLGVNADSVSVTDTGDLKFKTKVDGKVGETTLSELIRNHQIEAHVRNQSQALAEERKAFEAERQKLASELQQRVQQAAVLVEQNEANLLKEYNSVDWATLEMTDPGTFAAKRQKYAEQYQMIQQAKQQTGQEVQRLQQEQHQQHQQAYQSHLAAEREALKGSHPDLLEEKGRGELIEYLKARGMASPDNPWKRDFITGLVSNSEGLELLKKAMLYDRAQGDVKVAEKRVKRLPKIAKPGATKSKTQKKAAEHDQDMKSFRKVVRLKRGQESVDDLAAMINKHIL